MIRATNSLTSIFVALLYSVPLGSLWAEKSAEAPALAWPTLTRTSRPWAYWWWMGSAVDKTNLLHEFARYKQGGLGGVHIVPIYGAKGWESKYIEYLTPEWQELLRFAVTEAGRLELGIDMTLGTGWCFGGPEVTEKEANANVVVNTWEVAPGSNLKNRFDRGSIQAIVAFDPSGKAEEITQHLGEDGKLNWTPAKEGVQVLAISQQPSGNAVDRAAPGGEGSMLNPFFPGAIHHYLGRFDRAFEKYPGPMPRAIYHDSYEYVANWGPDLFPEFEKRRGYKLQEHLNKFFSKAGDDTVARLKGDYRETLSDLMVEQFNPSWVGWAHAHGSLTRNQAHGSPGNLLDLYAGADMPETEMFNKDRDLLVSKFASSAAHVAGRKYCSSETGTWLKEHFTEKLSDLKVLIDELFASGVNHIFYHGTCYSPDQAGWPGWVFYASTEMNPRNSIWHDAPLLNDYVSRCQSVLQSGHSDNDILVYWPIYDYWHDSDRMEKPCSVHHREWLRGQRIGAVSQALWDQGFTFDYISDRQLSGASVKDARVAVPGGPYRAIVVPACEHIPLPTLQHLVKLAQEGATLIFDEHLPKDVPGFAHLEERRAKLKSLLLPLGHGKAAGDSQSVEFGKGRVFIGDVTSSLTRAGIAREKMIDEYDLLLVRRSWEGGRHYFIVNHSGAPIQRSIPLATTAKAVGLMDPMTGRTGLASMRSGKAGTEVYVQLEPGASLLLRTFEHGSPKISAWAYAKSAGEQVELRGTWNVKFVAGGPDLPKPFTSAKLGSWTDFGDAEAQRFAGTATYSLRFDLPSGSFKPGSPAFIDLGEVCQSAKVRLNGECLGGVFMSPFRVLAKNLKAKGNLLEVEVTSVSANRIRDLDRRGVKWKKFHNINFVNMNYQPFDASNWPVPPCGLLGPVTIRLVNLESNPAAKSGTPAPPRQTRIMGASPYGSPAQCSLRVDAQKANSISLGQIRQLHSGVNGPYSKTAKFLNLEMTGSAR